MSIFKSVIRQLDSDKMNTSAQCWILLLFILDQIVGMELAIDEYRALWHGIMIYGG